LFKQSGTAAKGREITALDVAVADSWNDELAFRQGKFARRGLLEFRTGRAKSAGGEGRI